MKRKLLALWLAVVMVITMLPANVLAETTPAPEIPTNVPYTADLSTISGVDVKVGDTITIDILVGGTNQTFAAAELYLNYSGLTFVEAINDGGAAVTDTGSQIKIIDHGDSVNWAENGNITAYSLKFQVAEILPAETGTASITLAEAALSPDTDAASENLSEATVTVGTKGFNVTPADLDVTLDDELTSTQTTVVYGEDYAFEATNKNYTYEISVNGGTIEAQPDGDGKWIIENVTSDLEIEVVSATPKTYTITFSDVSHIKDAATAQVQITYGDSFSFTLQDDVAASLTAGTQYVLESILYTGTQNSVIFTTGTDDAARTYTIAAEHITGNITITTSASSVAPNQFTVTKPAEITELTLDKTVVDKGGSVEVTLNPVTGYKYTVTYQIGDGEPVEITNWTDGKATISGVTANVTISVTKEVDTSKITVTVTPYLALDSKTMYLVQVTSTLDNGYVYTYGGTNMYWSEEYNAGAGAYVFLVIMDASTPLDEAAAKTQISIAQGSVTATVNYSGDVNMAGGDVVDANDAQLVWKMYSAKTYLEFETASNGVTMEKFLRADVNKDGLVDTDDASEIVAIIIRSHT